MRKIYRYTEKDRAIIAAARKANKNKRAEKRLYALELRASGQSAKEIAAKVGFKERYIPQLTAKYIAGALRQSLETTMAGTEGISLWKKKQKYWDNIARKPQQARL